MSRNRTQIAIVLAAAGIMFATPRNVYAQTSHGQIPKWEFRVISGTLVPTGAQRDAVKRGNLNVAQFSRALRPHIAITASAGWARTRDLATAGDRKLNVFTYDLGGELRATRSLRRNAVTLRPFAGIGAGARSYDYRGANVDARHNVSGYASVGGELGLGRVGLRIEARNYVSGFKSLDGGSATDIRNDVVVMVGLSFKKQ